MQNKHFYNNYILTKEDEELLLSLYYDNIKFNEMIEITHFPHRKITDFFKRNNLNLVKRYKLNEQYFNTIDTDKKAYWLGYLWTDGFVGKGKYNNIVLSSIDEKVIDEFNKDISISGINFKKVHTDRSNSFGNNILYESRFSSFQMADSLRNRNITSNRKEDSFLNITDIDSEYMKYILFGMIDGDGHIEPRNGNLVGINLYASKNNSESYVDFVKSLNLSYSIKYNKERECNYIRFLLKDEYTRGIIKEYLNYSLIERKSAPSLS